MSKPNPLTLDPLEKNVELLADLALATAEITRKLCGVSPEKAVETGQAVADLMADLWGGQQFYFPKGMIRALSKRDREIYAKFDGANQAALAKEYNMSVQRIYCIIKLIRAEESARRQHGLFDGDGDGDGDGVDTQMAKLNAERRKP